MYLLQLLDFLNALNVSRIAEFLHRCRGESWRPKKKAMALIVAWSHPFRAKIRLGWEIVLGMNMYKLLVLNVGNGWELGLLGLLLIVNPLAKPTMDSLLTHILNGI